MKKILLFLLLITYSFSVDGFGELKWESPPEEFYKYYADYKYDVYNNSYFTLIYPNIYFEGENLERVELFYINAKLAQWMGLTRTSKESALKIYNNYKKKYKPENENITGNTRYFQYIDIKSQDANIIFITLKEYDAYSLISYSFSHTVK